MAKDEEWSGLLKIPAEVVISELRVKVGQLESYIAELEDKIKEIDVKNIKLTKLQHLENDNSRITEKYHDTQKRLADANGRVRRLETELLKLLKEKNGKTN